MLSTDLCLAMEGGGGGGGGRGRGNNAASVPLLAQTHNCCAWLEVTNLDVKGGDDFCGGTLNGDSRRPRDPETAKISNWWDPGNRNVCCS